MGNSYGAKKEFELNGKTYHYYRLKALEEQGIGKVSRLPFSIRVLLESLIRQHDGHVIKDEHVVGLAKWVTKEEQVVDVPFKHCRVILLYFTGVSGVVDLDSLCKAMVDMRGELDKIYLEVKGDLVIDHYVQVEEYGTTQSLQDNMNM